MINICKVSIVIPVYNTDKYLEECLQSVITQTYQKLEIICVNDGSTDNSLAILEKFAGLDNRVQVFSKVNEGKGGAASARNYGLGKATGKYIMFLDSDDFFEINMIELMVSSAENNDSDLVICTANVYDDSLKRIKERYKSIELKYAPHKSSFNYRDCSKHIFMIGEMIVWNKLFRLDFIKSNSLYFESIPISDDQYLPNLALILADRISVVDKQLVNYRINTGNSQVDSQNKNPKSAYLATFSVVKKMKELGVYDEVKQCYINVALRLMRQYFDRMLDFNNLSMLYHEYRENVFPFLEADNLNADYFYDSRLAEWYEMIQNNTLEEILMMVSRGYGTDMITAILRFQFPYNEVSKGSKLVLVGKGLVGRYWYAQLLLSDHAEVVAWVNDESEIPANLEYNQVIYAK